MAYERGRTGADLAERTAQQQRDRVAERADARDRAIAMDAIQRQAANAVQPVDAPQAYVQQVMPQATVADVTRAREQAIRGADIFGNTLIGRGMGLFGYDPRSAALAQTQRMMQDPRSTFQDGYLTIPTNSGFLQQGMLGNVTYTGMPDPTYTGFGQDLVRPAPREMGGDNVVPPMVDAVTGQQQCPDGYEFDANLNACRKITPTEFAPVSVSPAPDGRYARMGLLDQPPSGLLEAGFGSPADFTGANMAFRRQSAPMSSYFTDPRSYEGYTLI